MDLLYDPASLFSLESFSHSSLFDSVESNWQVLKKIEPYLKSLSLGKIEIEIPSQATIVHPELVTIEKGAVVEEGAYIKGPCFIGKGSVVRHGAYIRGNVITGEDCVIGHATEVKNAVFLAGAKAGHFAYVGDSILGCEVNLGAGTKLANFLLNRGTVSLLVNGKRVETGLQKFGALLGDGVSTGCNSVLNPGTILGKGCRVFPCTTVGGVVPSQTTLSSSVMRFQVNQKYSEVARD